MASIHKRDRSPFYWAAWRDCTGRLFYRSTKQTDRHKALNFALECERAEKHATAGTLTEAQARDIVASIMDRTQTGDTFRNPKAADWLREWLAGKESTKATSTGLRYHQTIEDFIRYLGPRANRPLVAITPRDIQGFIDHRARHGKVSPSTVNMDGRILRTALTRARKQGYISSNPAEAVDLPACDPVERGTFTPAEVGMLVAAAEGEWKTLLQLGYYSGARLSECCRAEWKDIDLVAGTIVFPVTKTGKAHIMPLHPKLAKHLEDIAADTAGPVMPQMADTPLSGRRGLSQQFLALMAKAGLDAEAVKGAARTFHRRTFHALRHSFTSALANAGVAPELRMKLTGHKSSVVHGGYTHHELRTLQAALSRLPKAG